ncbi:PREDICTED: carboxylesterase 5A-like [Nanorana parkeri]|uniref:carboxylesterase 5A-like n=1 Tax=Nanorana parkeri TaxID=125878 RepID=UPI0008542C74|nr:PREDICTED: carboxylesterase 5A-like [Nanorana parkeri]
MVREPGSRRQMVRDQGPGADGEGTGSRRQMVKDQGSGADGEGSGSRGRWGGIRIQGKMRVLDNHMMNKNDSTCHPENEELRSGMRSSNMVILSLLLCLILLGTGSGHGGPTLGTRYGDLRGVTVAVRDTPGTVDAFFGVPFAKPPVGPLRFANPEPPEGGRDCMGRDCIHGICDFQVMVFIHGGGLVIGGASLFEGSALSVYENVVVVTVQYRLGVLGFFSTGDEKVPGNFGVLDQVAALRWVQENIRGFGGDPESVIIIGQSAGALTVSTLVLSPMSEGLFHRAIAESGVPTLPGFAANTPEDLLFYNNPLISLPLFVDGQLLPRPVEDILVAGEMNAVPFMMGISEQEFGWMIPQSVNVTGLADGMDRETAERNLRSFPQLSLGSDVLPLVMEEYFEDVTDPLQIRDRFLDMCGDLVFVIPALKFARHYRDSGLPVFFYEFQHRPSLFRDTKPAFVRADHGDELLYVFGGPFLTDGQIFSSNFTEEEKILSKVVMKYWANFARDGDPNGPGLERWPRYEEDEGYLELGTKQKASVRLKGKRLQFWTEILPQKLRMSQQEREEL